VTSRNVWLNGYTFGFGLRHTNFSKIHFLLFSVVTFFSEQTNIMNEKRKYRWCFVPLCTNTQIRTPDKIFVQVLADKIRRKLWFKVAHRTDKPTKSCYYCYEDYFNVNTK